VKWAASAKDTIRIIVIGGVVCAGLLVSSWYSYVLFHTVVQWFTIIVAAGVFLVVWNARRFLSNHYFLFLGMGYLCSAVLTMLHTMSYKGLGIFVGYTANLPTQLWIADNFVAAGCLLVAPAFLDRRLRTDVAWVILVSVVVLTLLSIFRWDIFPDCFVEGAGQTSFKVISSYGIALLMSGAIVVLFTKRDRFDADVFVLLIASITVHVVALLVFTIYVDVYGLSNLIGHFLEVAAAYLMYLAVIKTALERPYDLLFREIAAEREALVQEVTERTKAELALKESEERYRQLVVMAPDGIIVIVRNRIVFVNPAAETIVRAGARDAVLGKPIGDFVHPGFRELVTAQIARMLDESTPVPFFEATILRQDGTTVDVEMAGIPVSYSGQRAVQMVLRDITQRKTDQEKQQQLIKEIRQFAYIISHDLRAPMINLRGFSEEIAAALQVLGPAIAAGLPMMPEQDRQRMLSAANEDLPESVEYIRSSVERMDRLIGSILNLSRMGHRELVLEVLDMQDIVRETVKALSHQIDRRQVSVIVGSLPPVVADRTAMEQIVANLIDNALKYLDPARPGEVEISGISLPRETLFEVRDNGRGIAPEDREVVFEIFRRVGPRTMPGEGMGLAYVRTLVRRHGGRIWCESNGESGSVFRFTLTRDIHGVNDRGKP
jgi:PAS domain S-box-containing protein